VIPLFVHVRVTSPLLSLQVHDCDAAMFAERTGPLLPPWMQEHSDAASQSGSAMHEYREVLMGLMFAMGPTVTGATLQ
jgi:hypothetical protein